MIFLIIVWWLVGAFGFLLTVALCEERLEVSDIALSLLAGIIGPLNCVIYVCVRFGDRVIWRRK